MYGVRNRIFRETNAQGTPVPKKYVQFFGLLQRSLMAKMEKVVDPVRINTNRSLLPTIFLRNRGRKRFIPWWRRRFSVVSCYSTLRLRKTLLAYKPPFRLASHNHKNTRARLLSFPLYSSLSQRNLTEESRAPQTLSSHFLFLNCSSNLLLPLKLEQDPEITPTNLSRTSGAMYIRRSLSLSLSLSLARQRLRSRTVKSAKQDLETDAEGKQRVVGTESELLLSSRKNLAQYSTISCEKKEEILDSGLRGPLKPSVGLELLNCESRDDNKTQQHAGDAQCKKLQQQPQPQYTNAQCRASHVLACTCAAARRLYFNCLFFFVLP
jgi:hypothetical protein